MKKSLLALAVLGAFAGAASAQSSVTIYGLLDQSVQRTNGGTAPNDGAVQGAAGRAYNLRASSQSRLGFRGNEDLGGGLSAQFQIEHRFDPDTGNTVAGSPFWQGRSYLQLTSSTLGSFYAGRDYMPSFWIQLRADPFGNDGIGRSGSATLLGGYSALDPSQPGAANATSVNVRPSNSIGYKTPNFQGFTAQIAGSASESNGTGRQYGANAEYLQGPIWAGVGYDRRTRAPAAQNDNQVVNIGAAYDFGFIRPGAYYARSETGLNGNNRARVWSLFATAPLAGGKVKVAYTDLDVRTAAAANPDRTKLGLGYDYPLSKRTNLYADFGYAKADRVGATSFSNNKAGAFGIKHTF